MTQTEEKQIVDTLFGKQEESVSADFDYDAELPHVLFGDDNQDSLPLIDVPLYEPVCVESTPRALMPYLDELSLFEKRWGCGLKDAETRDEWCERMNKDLVPVLNAVRAVCERDGILQPRAAYVYVNAKACGDRVDFYASDGKMVFASLTFPRRADGASPADKFSSGKAMPVALIAATVGKTASDIAKKWLLLGQDTEYGCLDGFVRETVRAMTAYAAAIVNGQNCCVGDVFEPNGENGKLFAAFVKAVQADRIGVEYGANHTLAPKYSALALVLPK